MIWNHGSERNPGRCQELAKFYGARGYAFFLPHRGGHGRSPGDWPVGELRARLGGRTEERAVDRRQLTAGVIEMHERHLEDTLAAVDWLADQSFVDAESMVMSGVSAGGVQALLAAEADAGMCAYLPFAPAAMGWQGNPELHERLLRAVKQAQAPIFLLQAENDFSLGPSEVLGAELERKGPPNRVRVYPPYGDSQQSGHGAFACEGTDVWGSDVCAFLERAGLTRSEP